MKDIDKLASATNENTSEITENEIQSLNESDTTVSDAEKTLSETASSEDKPKKPRTQRKKREKSEVPENSAESSLESDSEKEDKKTAEETIPCDTAKHEDVTEDSAPPEHSNEPDYQNAAPALSISAQSFDISTENSAHEESDGDIFSLCSETKADEEETIIPPDQLFAYMSSPADQAEITEADTEADEPPVNVETISEHEENVSDDGQYMLADLELQSDEQDKIYVEEEIPKYDPKKPRSIDNRFDLVELFVFTLLAVMIITTFFFRHSIVEGSSMENTLHSGEHLIISDIFYTPKSGDIIVCEDYTTEIRKPIVKRVIAVAGDRVTVTTAGEVYINGKLLDEDYVFIDGRDDRPPVDLIVPVGEIFVMGDHRNASKDSRDIGTVSVDSVLGKVLLRFYPFDKFGTVD